MDFEKQVRVNLEKLRKLEASAKYDSNFCLELLFSKFYFDVDIISLKCGCEFL